MRELSGITYNTSMKLARVVINTNVLLAALRSKRGASYQILVRIGAECFEPAISVALVLEYEAATKRLLMESRLTARDIEAVIDFICAHAVTGDIFYLWRPQMKDPKDDMVLEVAASAGCTHIVTFNTRDFAGAERFGVKVVTPRVFLAEIGVKR